MLTMFTLYSLLGAISVCALVKTAYSSRASKNDGKRYRPNIGTAAQSIINLIETDPKGWTFVHKKQEGEVFVYPYYKHNDAGVQITMELDCDQVRGIWRPAVVILTVDEKRAIMEALKQMISSRIEDTIMEKIMGTGLSPQPKV